jgi:hypothetical protein
LSEAEAFKECKRTSVPDVTMSWNTLMFWGPTFTFSPVSSTTFHMPVSLSQSPQVAVDPLSSAELFSDCNVRVKPGLKRKRDAMEEI